MRKMMILAVLMTTAITASAAMKNSWPTSFNPYSNCMVTTSYNLTKVADDDGWILIGEKIMTAWSIPSIRINLYVREIAQRLIYRVEYGGKYYALKTHQMSDGETKYSTYINGNEYYFYDEK